MPHCCAFGCNNQSNFNTKVSYHKLPNDKNKQIRKAWINAIGRTELPKNTHLCSDHFEDDCFDQSQDMKIRLLPVGSNIKRKLNADAIPTKFKHKEKKNSTRAVSVTRAKKKEHEEVRKKYTHAMKLIS